MENENIITKFNYNNKNEEPTYSTIWRYMSLNKFISLLQTNTLFFSCLTEMNDPLEGANYRDSFFIKGFFGACNKGLETKEYNIKNFKKALDALRNYQQNFFTCCFYSKQSESRVMYESYSSENGVAIKFNYKSILSEINKHYASTLDTDFELGYGKVEYYEFNHASNFFKLFLNDPNEFNFDPFTKEDIHKHEEEFRFLFYNKNHLKKINNIQVVIDLKSSILEIVAHPNSLDWEINILNNLIKTYNLDFQLKKSKIITTEAIKRIL